MVADSIGFKSPALNDDFDPICPHPALHLRWTPDSNNGIFPEVQGSHVSGSPVFRSAHDDTG